MYPFFYSCTERFGLSIVWIRKKSHRRVTFDSLKGKLPQRFTLICKGLRNVFFFTISLLSKGSYTKILWDKNVVHQILFTKRSIHYQATIAASTLIARQSYVANAYTPEMRRLGNCTFSQTQYELPTRWIKVYTLIPAPPGAYFEITLEERCPYFRFKNDK